MSAKFAGMAKKTGNADHDAQLPQVSQMQGYRPRGWRNSGRLCVVHSWRI
jgi:hypothetical protein